MWRAGTLLSLGYLFLFCVLRWTLILLSAEHQICPVQMRIHESNGTEPLPMAGNARCRWMGMVYGKNGPGPFSPDLGLIIRLDWPRPNCKLSLLPLQSSSVMWYFLSLGIGYTLLLNKTAEQWIILLFKTECLNVYGFTLYHHMQKSSSFLNFYSSSCSHTFSFNVDTNVAMFLISWRYLYRKWKSQLYSRTKYMPIRIFPWRTRLWHVTVQYLQARYLSCWSAWYTAWWATHLFTRVHVPLFSNEGVTGLFFP